jgi:hypothetical protein
MPRRRATVPTGARAQTKALIAGVVVIGLVTAFGLHAAQLPPLIKNTASAGSGVLGTAETG